MEIVYKKIEDLKPYEKNPRNNKNAIDPVANSIKEFGFKVPIVIDKNNEIVCGHTRYLASKKLNLDKVPCIIADDLTEEQIKAFRLADNKTSDYSEFDNKLLLEELACIPDDLFTGFGLNNEFNQLLDEKETLFDGEFENYFEITFKSTDKTKIEQIKDYWEQLNDEEE